MKKILFILLLCSLCMTGCLDTGEIPQTEQRAEEGAGEIPQTEQRAEEGAGDVKQTAFVYETDASAVYITADYPAPLVNADGSVTVEGLGGTYEKTSLPFHSIKLVLPENTAPDSIEAAWGDAQKIEHVELKENEYAAASGAKGGQGDALSAREEDKGWRADVMVQEFEGVRVAYVTIFPVTYDNASEELQYTKRVSITLRLKQEPWDLSHLTNVDYIKDLVDNPEALDGLGEEGE